VRGQGLGFGDELTLAELSAAHAATDAQELRRLCAEAARLIQEQQEAISFVSASVVPAARGRGRPRKIAEPHEQRRAGRPLRYGDAIVDAFEALKVELRAQGRPHSDLDTARELFERYGRRHWTFPNRKEEETFFQRLAKRMSARRNRRPKIGV
jgi:hypothetical protein